ncbi:hypothetical protein ACRE_046470 [Hapsidospora chrysogenum ATCC 11550]|uniref:Uncharacterized protein n=1 Tax=Hapsidospora chrysogenum (strain ATCC 11550 / CBS 779.69 / DSM 880 / IAM 14645 / JCM 23072 / IMI 49137) TaxID=857340 RepID=A0A086T5B1_HAPC1|nr:hypothetical protein ACRE_046470 [Hapsidospora chrysogenum ATCC 11550]
MAKRSSNLGDSEADGDAALRKRQKITHQVPAGEDVYSGDQLRKLLSFDQDLHRARHGLQSLKRLLDDILSTEGDRAAKFDILRQYLEAVKPRHIDEDAVYLPDIMEMWSFAVQVNNDGVMSSVAVALALLLQAISGQLSLVPHGLGICQTLIQERQLKSLSRNLSVEKGKGFIISPTLRLLREAVSLDGGAFAKRIFRARASTFASLGRNLEVGQISDGQEDARKTSVRTNAVKFLLSCVKYLHSEGRRELLSQRELLSHLTFLIKSDPPYLVQEILSTLKTHVLMDDKLPREVKFKNFNTKSLVRFLGLYTYGTSAQDEDDRKAVSDKAHEFLIHVCTTPAAGILYPCTGLYPKPSDDEDVSNARIPTADGLGESLIEDNYKNEIPVYNFVLSEFAQKLRPWASLKHSELLVAIFRAAPELIADYFLHNRSFTFEPKLSMTWIGYSAFLFNCMQIPLPEAFGDRKQYAHAPPPTSILLDNIIPLPIDQKVLVRCLSHKSNLISFFATRILVLALEKLDTAIEMHQSGSRRGDAFWSDSVRRLVDAFCQRIPDMKEIVRSYKAVPVENLLHKTLASRLLRLCYDVAPRVALAASFDVSPLFVDVLRKVNEQHGEPEAKAFGVMELENLVSIASHSPGMRWFAKVDNVANGVSSSPFTALLRVLCSDNQHTPSSQIRRTLGATALENQLVSQAAGLRPLLQALRATVSLQDGRDLTRVWAFVDECINRCASAPVKYLELLESYQGDARAPEDTVSLVNVAIVEQLPFATASISSQDKATLADFLSLYFTAADISEEDSKLTRLLYKKVKETMSSSGVSVGKLGTSADLTTLAKYPMRDESAEDKEGRAGEGLTAISRSKLEELLRVPVPDEEDTSVLVKWSTRNVGDLVEDGWAARLIRLLSSPHTHIRKEAFTNILKMAAKIKESSYEEKDQVWLLLSEVAESSRTQVDAGPVPSAFTAFATRAIDVLGNPLHPLYPKVNSFLTRSPVWSPDKLPLAHDILHGSPSDDDRYYTEITWLLAYLLDSLVTPADLSVFHRKRWLEKILALGSNPYLRANLRTRVLRIIYRATEIESGSTTLVTRFGVLAWLDAQRAACDGEDEATVLEALMRRVWETCDRERVTKWSRGRVLRIIEALPQP